MKKMKKIIYFLFKSRKPLQTTIKEGNTIKPQLSIFSSCAPRSFLEKTPDWDAHLYKNIQVVEDK